MGKENYIFSQMGKEEGDTSDKLSNQFLQLKAVVAFQKIFINLCTKYNYSTAAVFFPLVFPPRARCSSWQATESQVFTAIENNY